MPMDDVVLKNQLQQIADMLKSVTEMDKDIALMNQQLEIVSSAILELSNTIESVVLNSSQIKKQQKLDCIEHTRNFLNSNDARKEFNERVNELADAKVKSYLEGHKEDLTLIAKEAVETGFNNKLGKWSKGLIIWEIGVIGALITAWLTDYIKIGG